MPKQRKRLESDNVTFEDHETVRKMIGVHDEYVGFIESLCQVGLVLRGGRFTIKGDRKDVRTAKTILGEMYVLVREGYPLTFQDIERISRFAEKGDNVRIGDLLKHSISVPANGKTIFPKTPAQREYVKAIKSHDMVISIGPAGTGKTYLAMAAAVEALMDRKYDRIILTRPAVEAGERLGFLPGALEEKINPYLRPLYDALHDMMEIEQARHLIEQGAIEVAPLAYMRGRTLNSSFVILDEAQNCTTEQMKMFLTRMGFDSKYVVTGDVTQIDLPSHSPSGLVEAVDILTDINGIHFQYFTDVDVVRHNLVQKIVKAYERNRTKQEVKGRRH